MLIVKLKKWLTFQKAKIQSTANPQIILFFIFTLCIIVISDIRKYKAGTKRKFSIFTIGNPSTLLMVYIDSKTWKKTIFAY